MSNIKKKSATIGLKEYIENYRRVEHFLTFCRECDGFGKTWACPPFEREDDFAEYNYATLFGYQIFIDEEQRNVELSAAEFAQKTRELLGTVRDKTDEEMLMLEKKNRNSRALFGGSCRVCPVGECTRLKAEPCVHPEKMRPSLEAMGFDVGLSTSKLLGIELKWGTTKLPEYYTLVYAVFSKEPLIMDK